MVAGIGCKVGKMRVLFSKQISGNLPALVFSRPSICVSYCHIHPQFSAKRLCIRKLSSTMFPEIYEIHADLALCLTDGASCAKMCQQFQFTLKSEVVYPAFYLVSVKGLMDSALSNGTVSGRANGSDIFQCGRCSNLCLK